MPLTDVRTVGFDSISIVPVVNDQVDESVSVNSASESALEPRPAIARLATRAAISFRCVWR
jgi:hypothetical protein